MRLVGLGTPLAFTLDRSEIKKKGGEKNKKQYITTNELTLVIHVALRGASGARGGLGWRRIH